VNVIKMHKATSDKRSNKDRVMELRESFLSFKSIENEQHAMNVLKNCLSLVNDVIEYSAPIKLDSYYKSYAKSFVESSLERRGQFNYFSRFDYDHKEFIKNGLHNDLAPRFYCKNWFSTIIGVLEIKGMTLEEIENRYYEYLEHPNYVQSTIFEFV
jgi:hypothetical protein